MIRDFPGPRIYAQVLCAPPRARYVFLKILLCSTQERSVEQLRYRPYYPSLVDSLDRFQVDITVLDRDLERAGCRALDPITRREILQSRLLKSPELAYFLRNRKFETFDQLVVGRARLSEGKRSPLRVDLNSLIESMTH
jgi:hypothetical protein